MPECHAVQHRHAQLGEAFCPCSVNATISPRIHSQQSVCASVCSLQPMHVGPSLPHIWDHRFASRMHLRTTGLVCDKRMRRPVPTHSTCKHCLCFCPRSLAHACESIAAAHLRPSASIAVLAATESRPESLGCWLHVQVCEATDTACQNHWSN